MAGRGRKKDRPDPWTPESFLESLRAHGDRPLRLLHAKLCALIPGDHPAEPLDLIGDVLRWRKLEPGFARQYFALTRGTPDGGSTPRLEDRPGMEDWQVRLCEAFVRTRKERAACEQVGVAYSTVRAKTSPGNKSYDEAFAELWNKAKLEVVGRYEDDVEDAMEEARLQGDAKTVLWGAFEYLGRRDKEKWARREERYIEGSVHHTHTLIEARQSAVLAAGAISQKLFAPVAAEETIEGEILKERAG